MVKCEECRKKLVILQGYKHLALGKRFPVCRNCVNIVSGNMQKLFKDLWIKIENNRHQKKGI